MGIWAYFFVDGNILTLRKSVLHNYSTYVLGRQLGNGGCSNGDVMITREHWTPWVFGIPTINFSGGGIQVCGYRLSDAHRCWAEREKGSHVIGTCQERSNRLAFTLHFWKYEMQKYQHLL